MEPRAPANRRRTRWSRPRGGKVAASGDVGGSHGKRGRETQRSVNCERAGGCRLPSWETGRGTADNTPSAAVPWTRRRIARRLMGPPGFPRPGPLLVRLHAVSARCSADPRPRARWRGVDEMGPHGWIAGGAGARRGPLAPAPAVASSTRGSAGDGTVLCRACPWRSTRSGRRGAGSRTTRRALGRRNV